eukprot:scaffold76344_cov77-Phaeocystis_antarctica.AAC.2
MLTDERRSARHPGAASMQLHGTAHHCRLLCQSLRALKSCATLAPSPPHSRRRMPADMCELVWGEPGTFLPHAVKQHFRTCGISSPVQWQHATQLLRAWPRAPRAAARRARRSGIPPRAAAHAAAHPAPWRAL